MRAIIGMVLAVAAGIAGAYGIVDTVEAATCVELCSSPMGSTPFLIGGVLALVAASIFWRYAMVVAPIAGLATAAVLLTRNGVNLFGANLGFTVFIAVCVLAGPLIVVAIALYTRGRRRQAQEIAQNGLHAVAVVASVSGTGLYINNQPQVAIRYQIEPLDGSPPFIYDQRRTLGFGEIAPRPGLRWPAWYLAGRTDKVAIGAPSGLPDASTLALLEQFGIAPAQAYGFDPTTTGAPPTAYGSAYASFD